MSFYTRIGSVSLFSTDRSTYMHVCVFWECSKVTFYNGLSCGHLTSLWIVDLLVQ